MTRSTRPGGGGRDAVPRRGPARSVAVLDGIRVSWEWLCAAPHPVTVPGDEIAGVADRPIPLGELRTLALDPATPGGVRDAVWAYLVARSRRDGPTWTVACAGMGLPMLAGSYRDCVSRARAGRIDRTSGADREEIASAVVTGFVAALATVRIDRPGIASALRWAALRGGLAAVREALDAPAARPHDRLLTDALAGRPLAAGADPDSTEAAARGWTSSPPTSGSGHPDLVLAVAVADGVITAGEAELIGETRLQRVPLGEVAARSGHTVGAVTMRRLRAELRLIDHLLGVDAADHDTDTDPGGEHRPPRSPSSQSARSSARSSVVRSVSRSSRRVSGRSATASRVRAARSVGGDDTVAGRRSPSVSARRRRTRGARRAEARPATR